MKTSPLYLDDPYLKEMDGTVLDVLPESEGIYRLILDRTVFYPMGGGQPTDQGRIIFTNGESVEVYQVLLKEGEINHYIKKNDAPEIGMIVKGRIDWERRFKNMRVHSAAHVIDFSMYLLGYSPSLLKPLKGDHGKKPFIQYAGVLNKDIKAELQQRTDEMVSEGRKFSWGFDSFEKLEKEAIYLQPGLPKNKPLRSLALEGVGVVADGGTIVASTFEVGKVVITEIKETDGYTLVYYKIISNA